MCVKKTNDSIDNILFRMWWQYYCPLFRWNRNSSKYNDYYYYRLLALLDRKWYVDAEFTERLRQDICASRNSFDRLYGIALSITKLPECAVSRAGETKQESQEENEIKKIKENTEKVIRDDIDFKSTLECILQDDDMRNDLKVCLSDNVRKEALSQVIKIINKQTEFRLKKKGFIIGVTGEEN